ncbi:hypothetical protein ATN89_10400 [Comamonas thiooxydans]|nr:hypothetical protein ATN89_10400 [Comamonas thiooxydans]
MLAPTATLSGVWVAREEVAIASPLEGLRVVEVLVESGDRVEVGQLLARLERSVLDSQTRQSAQAVQRARAEFGHANEQHQRAQRLMPAGAVSRQEYEAARASMLAARANLQQAEAAGEEQRTRQAHAEIRAPFAGAITQRDIQLGALVGPQTSLFRLASSQPPEFLAQVPQHLLPDLVVGMSVTVNTSGREGVLPGTVRLLSTVVDTASGYGQSRIAVTEAPATIRAGSVGNARITLTPRDVLAVDARAVRFDSTPYVFVVEAGRAKRTPVRVGLRQSGWVEVLSGVDAASRVVVAGANLLQDGDPVQTQEAHAQTPVASERSRSISRLLFKLRLWLWMSVQAPMTAFKA